MAGGATQVIADGAVNVIAHTVPGVGTLYDAYKLKNTVEDLTGMEFVNPLSEYLHQVIIDIKVELGRGLYIAVADIFESFNADLEANMNQASSLATNSIQSFASGSLFSKIMDISKNVFTPLAAIIFCVVFAWEFSQMVSESNRMDDKPVYKIVTSLIRLALCLIVITHAMDIVLYFFKLGQFATSRIASISGYSYEGISLTLPVPAPVDGQDYPFANIFKLIGCWLIILIARGAVVIISVMIYMKIIIWFIEFGIYDAPAAMPMATWANKEWSQLGMNYVRKGLALAFEGPMMLFIFSLYGAISTLMFKMGHQDLFGQIGVVIGGAVIVYAGLKKVPQITSSIFNAH